MLQKVYDDMDQQIQCAKAKHQHILLIEDMNCRVGDAARGNKPEVTVGGKMLKKMVKNNNLIIVNNVEEYQGSWTRQSGKDVSIIDYIIITEEDRDNIRSAIMDEEKMVAPLIRLKKKLGQNSYEKNDSDHNVTKITINWCGEHERKTDGMTRKVMTTKSYKKFRQLVGEDKISQIWDSEDGDEKSQYTRWSQKIVQLKKRCEKAGRSKTESKAIRQLRTIKRDPRKQRKDAKSYEKREQLAVRMEPMSKHIEREKKKQSVRKVIKVAEFLSKKNGSLNESMFWKYKQRTSSRKI